MLPQQLNPLPSKRETDKQYDPFSNDHVSAEEGISNPVNKIPKIQEASSPEIPVAPLSSPSCSNAIRPF